MVPVQEYIVSCSHWKGKAQVSRAPHRTRYLTQGLLGNRMGGAGIGAETHPQERQPYLLDVHLDLPSAIFVKRFEST